MTYLYKRGNAGAEYQVRTLPDRYFFILSVPSDSTVPDAIVAWCAEYGLETPTDIVEE